MRYNEELPEQCPPSDCRPEGDYVLYRMCKNSPPNDWDFTSWRSRNPDRNRPPGVTECRARSLSTQDDLNKLKKLKKLPRFKGKTLYWAELSLTASDGPSKQTTDRRSHFSWWRSADFEITSSTRMVP